jgi:HSP20 family molecular chaperone IbpA
MAVVQWNPAMPWRPFQQPWSPFEGLESLRHEMDRLLESFAGHTQPSSIRQSEWMPRVDLLEHEHAFVLVADLPGMQQEDIHVLVQDNMLTLEGTRTFAPVEHGQGTYHDRERTSGTCCRRFLDQRAHLNRNLRFCMKMTPSDPQRWSDDSANASSNAFASCKSRVSNPSINHPYTGASRS